MVVLQRILRKSAGDKRAWLAVTAFSLLPAYQLTVLAGVETSVYQLCSVVSLAYYLLKCIPSQSLSRRFLPGIAPGTSRPGPD